MSDDEAEQTEQPQSRGGLGGAVQAGLQGEQISARGLLDTIGGWRGIVESVLPAAVYLGFYIFTRDPRISAIAPLAIALLAFGWRLVRREPWQGAVSGLIGVAVCVAVTMFTGRGEDYFLPGFWINGVWIVALTVSLLAGWPLIGLLAGFLSGSLTEWRSKPLVRRAARACTLLWIGVFGARLIVQLPLYFAAQDGNESAVDALGMARLFMGIPLFALAVALTWIVMSRAGEPDTDDKSPSPSSDESGSGNVENTGEKPPRQ